MAALKIGPMGQSEGAAAALERLAAGLDGTSPGFAGRVRDAAPALSRLDEALAKTFTDVLERLIAVEGTGREATQGLLARSESELRAIGDDALREWYAAFEAIARRSQRAGSLFAAAVLPAVARSATARAESLARAAAAVEELGRRHGADPILQRFAARAGELLAERGGQVVEAWAELCEVTRFGGRKPADVLDPIEAPDPLSDEALAATIRVATRVGERDRLRAIQVFRTGPGVVARVPQAVQGPALTLLTGLASSPESCVDALEVLAPVLRRIPSAARPMALELGLRIAMQSPRAASPYLRRVLRIGETVGFADGLTAFVEKGLSLAETSEDAARAFFALESQSALAFLASQDTGVSFDEIESTLRGYLRLIAPAAPSPEGQETPGLFPVIHPEAETLPVSRRAALFPTWEENFTLVKLQATLAVIREEQGTLSFALDRWREGESGGLLEFYRRFRAPDAAAGLFAHVEAARSQPELQRCFPGLAADVGRLRRRIFPSDTVVPALGIPGAILFLALGGDVEALPVAESEIGEELIAFARRAQSGQATVYDSASLTASLCERLEDGELIRVYGIEDLLEDDPYMAYVLEEGEARPGPAAIDESRFPQEDGRTGRGHRVGESAEGAPADPEMLRAYLEQNLDVAVLRAESPLDPMGLFVAGLTGSEPSLRDEKRLRTTREQLLALSAPRRRVEEVFLHDEWDYRIADYRPAWCRVHELAIEGENASFFSATLHRYAEMLPEVRRHFQRVKPEGYRIVHGLLDGEDFDLNAVVEARSDLRARREPSAKLYTTRQREERDVATLFLLDMSASTDEEAEPAPLAEEAAPSDSAALQAARRSRRGRRVIDIQKEALVIMAQALEEIGDLYAIYGFSGHGRDRVEFFDVKTFDEPLSLSVRSRIGAIEPQRSTRMGAALRQAIRKLAVQPSRARHLLLLSDGFPQDFDYGEDRRSNLYGLRDTTMALREAQRAGITTFCITVDRAGNDYLREMCDEKNYLVIEDIRSLPRELPKIYSEATRG